MIKIVSKTILRSQILTLESLQTKKLWWLLHRRTSKLYLAKTWAIQWTRIRTLSQRRMRAKCVLLISRWALSCQSTMATRFLNSTKKTLAKLVRLGILCLLNKLLNVTMDLRTLRQCLLALILPRVMVHSELLTKNSPTGFSPVLLPNDFTKTSDKKITANHSIAANWYLINWRKSDYYLKTSLCRLNISNCKLFINFKILFC